jgi:hypothetical protein
MSSRFTRTIVGTTSALAVAALLLAVRPSDGQTAAYRAPRLQQSTAPNLNGTWQVMNTANWDIQDHMGGRAPVLASGAWGAEPPGLGIVENNEIPYTPAALAKKRSNYAKRLELDPEMKCYLPGVPRAMYMPHPFKIVQADDRIIMAFSYANTTRVIEMKKAPEVLVDTWMGYSSGKWDKDTLVIDTRGFNADSWFDRAGNHHSEALHVVERITPVSADRLNYEATIEDPNVFTRPWKMSMNLYRRVGRDADLLEFQCVEWVEEMMYGEFVKKTK